MTCAAPEFGLSNGTNPLDSSICHNVLEAARCDKPVSVKKAPVSGEIIKCIIDKLIMCWRLLGVISQLVLKRHLYLVRVLLVSLLVLLLI